MSSSRIAATVLLSVFASLAITGCRVSHQNQNGDNNVKVATPFGSMQVKTNEAAAQTSVGLPNYPGAELVKKEHGADHDSGAADINMSFGSFQLRVKAISYRTPDSTDKVRDFYRNALHRYGDIIECSNGHAVGKPDHTAEGLTCDSSHNSRLSVDEDLGKKLELKAGSEKHQHIVSIEHQGAGTQFALVALDLPGHISLGGDQPQPED